VARYRKKDLSSSYLVFIPRFDHTEGTMEILVEDKVLEAMNDPGLLWVDFMEKAKWSEQAVQTPVFFNTEGKRGAIELMAFVELMEKGMTTFITFDVRE